MRIGQESHIFNAEIRSRRESLGLTQKELGLKIGYTNGQLVGHAENLRITGIHARVIRKLSFFFGVLPEVLCPPWLVMMDGLPKRSIRIAEIKKSQLEQKVAEKLLAIDMAATESPVDIDRDQLIQTVQAAAQLLTPIEQEVVRLYFGLDGEGERSHKEISKILKRKKVKHILHRATMKLRKNKDISKDLRHLYDSGTRRTTDFRMVLGEPDGKTSFYLPDEALKEKG